MPINKYITVLLFPILFFTSCVEEFHPEVSEYENLLVIEGEITTDPPPYIIRLSRSDNLDNAIALPVKGATIQIIDDLGHIEQLIEDIDGTYNSSPNGMRGQSGSSYQLRITTIEGETYESSFETIHKSLQIDSLFTVPISFISEVTNENVYGLQFYSSSKFTPVDTHFYLVDLFETYKYEASFKIWHYYDGKIRDFDDQLKYYTCWKDETIKQFFTFSNQLKLNPQISLTIPLHFISTSKNKKQLSVRYSLLAKQKTINKTAYKYFADLESLLSAKSNLYSKQPFQIKGNIICTSDKNKQALGYFLGAGISKKRFFIDRPEIFFYEYECLIETDDMKFIRYTNPKYYPVYLGINEFNQIGLPNAGSCLDCRVFGGTINKPEYWID